MPQCFLESTGPRPQRLLVMETRACRALGGRSWTLQSRLIELPIGEGPLSLRVVPLRPPKQPFVPPARLCHTHRVPGDALGTEKWWEQCRGLCSLLNGLTGGLCRRMGPLHPLGHQRPLLSCRPQGKAQGSLPWLARALAHSRQLRPDTPAASDPRPSTLPAS